MWFEDMMAMKESELIHFIFMSDGHDGNGGFGIRRACRKAYRGMCDRAVT